MPRDERRPLRIPDAAVEGAGVDEHDGRSLSLELVVDPRALDLGDSLGHRFFLRMPR